MSDPSTAGVLWWVRMQHKQGGGCEGLLMSQEMGKLELSWGKSSQVYRQ